VDLLSQISWQKLRKPLVFSAFRKVRPSRRTIGLLTFQIKYFRKTLNIEEPVMAKPSHKVKKANHGKRPANNRGRKIKNKKIKTP
jgi:hypothetical protein